MPPGEGVREGLNETFENYFEFAIAMACIKFTLDKYVVVRRKQCGSLRKLSDLPELANDSKFTNGVLGRTESITLA